MKDSTLVWSPTPLEKTREISGSQSRVRLQNSAYWFWEISILKSVSGTWAIEKASQLCRSDGHVFFSPQCLQSFTEWQTEKQPGVSDTRATTKKTWWRGWTWSWATRSVCPVRVMPSPHPSSAGTKTGRSSRLGMEWSFSQVGRHFPVLWQSQLCASYQGWVTFSGGQVLQIARVRKEDAGRYTCQAVNEAGEDHMHFELHILGMAWIK